MIKKKTNDHNGQETKERVLVTKGTNDSRWFNKEIRKQKRLYEKEIKNGVTDLGFLWASLYLEVFIEGVFTKRPVPTQIEVEVPKGVFKLTTFGEEDSVKWLIRNDTFGCIVVVNPQNFFEWALESYPEGIGEEGYLTIVLFLLTLGCKEESERHAIWDAMFYDKVEEAA